MPIRHKDSRGDHHDDRDDPAETAKTDDGMLKTVFAGANGLPAVVLQQVGPSLFRFAGKYPRLAKFTSGTAFVAFMAVAAANYSHETLKFAMSQVMASCTIDEEDPLAEAVREWLLSNARYGKRTSLMAMSADFARIYKDRRVKKKENVIFEGSSPLQFFRAQGRYFVYAIEKNPKMVKIWTAGFSTAPIQNLLREIQTKNDSHEEIMIWQTATHDRSSDYYWKPTTGQHRRSWDTVILDTQLKAELLTELTDYLEEGAEGEYAARGIPYRRGYLLYGKPGCGKTSFSMAVAGHFRLDIYIVSLTDPELTDSKLLRLFQTLDDRSLVLLEDIACAGLDRAYTEKKSSTNSDTDTDTDDSDSEKKNKKEKKEKKEKKSKITLSGLLNCIDGATAPTGHVLIMTTNCPEKLDAALIRPGRVDRRIEFTLADREQTRDLFIKLYGPIEDSPTPMKYDAALVPGLAEKFADMVPAGTFSPAQIQEYLLQHRGRPEVAVAKAKAMVATHLRKTTAEGKKKATSFESPQLPNSNASPESESSDHADPMADVSERFKAPELSGPTSATLNNGGPSDHDDQKADANQKVEPPEVLQLPSGKSIDLDALMADIDEAYRVYEDAETSDAHHSEQGRKRTHSRYDDDAGDDLNPDTDDDMENGSADGDDDSGHHDDKRQRCEHGDHHGTQQQRR